MLCYALVLSPVLSWFRSFRCRFFPADEAHNIKNVASIRHQKLNRFHARRRLLLTGTPLQNNLKELCALLHFLMPSLFRNFAHEDNAKYWTQADASKVTRMKRILAPFMLRRLKQDVHPSLKPKEERLEAVQLAAGRQREVYIHILQHTTAEWTTRMGMW